jgi:adenylate kinase family enzyme
LDSKGSPHHYDLSRVVVVGTSGAGKTTFARRLAGSLGVRHIELDALHWDSGWVPKGLDEFRQSVGEAVAQERWVVDGNYSVIRDLVWPRTTSVIWLNYPFITVFCRVFWRTIRRVIQRKELYSCNRESLRKAFLSRDSILWWMITTYSRRRRQFRALQNEDTFPHLSWLEFQHPRQAEELLNALAGSDQA